MSSSKTSQTKRTSPPRPAPKSSRRGVIIAVAAFLAGAVVFAVTSGKSGKSKTSTSPPASAVGATTSSGPGEQQPVVVAGDALPTFASGTDPAVGKAAPKLTGFGFDGKPVSIDPADGKPKVIAFVAHWCPHCQREVPLIVQWHTAASLPAGIDVYAVSTSSDKNGPNYPPSAWLTKVGWPFPALADSSNADAARAYGLSGFPFFVVVRADGTVASRTSGEKTLDEVINLFNTSKAA